MNKIKTLVNRIKNNEYKLIIRSILLRITPAWIDRILPIPQSYSFFLIGDEQRTTCKPTYFKRL